MIFSIALVEKKRSGMSEDSRSLREKHIYSSSKKLSTTLVPQQGMESPNDLKF